MTADAGIPSHWTCGCPWHAGALRRRTLLGGFAGLGALAATPGWAQGGEPQGVRDEVGRTSRFAKLVPAEQIENSASQQYRQMLAAAGQQRALAPMDHPQLQRLRAIAERLRPHTVPWNPRAAQWRWEVNLIGSRELNAFCMPGGKIAFYFGILQRLQLDDDEVASIMGHEMAHALREHARERIGKSMATRAGAGLLSSLLGLGQLGDTALSVGADLLTLQFGREDESEADLVGMELAARAGYDPAAGARLWQKMMSVSKRGPPEFLSTHPAGKTRIKDIQAMLPRVQALYERAERPPRRYAPPSEEQNGR